MTDDPTLTSAVQQSKQHQYSTLANVQPLYENTTVQPSSPTNPAIYASFCKSETSYWHHNAAGIDPNVSDFNVIFNTILIKYFFLD